MENLNLPPFYVGQKVVALNNFSHYKKGGFNTPQKGSTYIVRELVQLEGNSGIIWCVRLMEVRNKICRFAGGIVGEVAWTCTQFRELEKLPCGKLELTKVLEKVDEFVFPN